MDDPNAYPTPPEPNDPYQRFRKSPQGNGWPPPTPPSAPPATPPPFGTPPGYNSAFGGIKTELPGATTALVMGILALIGGCVYGVFGLIFGGIGLYQGNRDRQLYHLDPHMYSNYGTSQAGRIMSIIGLVMGGIWALFFLVVLIVGVGFGR